MNARLGGRRNRAEAIMEVVPDGEGATPKVHGRPKGSLLTTGWGEDAHAGGVQKELRSSIERKLAA